MKRLAFLFVALLALPARAEDDLEALWKDACLWEVGSNLEKVPAARKKLIEAKGKTLDFLIPGKLDAADTIITRALSMVILGIAGEEAADPVLRKRAVDGLMTALTSDKPAVRRNAADLLGQLGAKEAAPEIAKLLTDKDARGGALAALGALKVDSSVPAIIGLLKTGETERLRVACVVTLGSIGGAAAQEALLATLSDKASPVRFAAQYALEGLRSVGALRLKLSDPDKKVRLHALSALGRIGERSVRTDIRPLASDPDPMVRGFAIEALTEMLKPSDREWMKEMLEGERDPFVRGKLEAALRRIDQPVRADR